MKLKMMKKSKKLKKKQTHYIGIELDFIDIVVCVMMLNIQKKIGIKIMIKEKLDFWVSDYQRVKRNLLK